MKIRINYLNDTSNADKNARPNRASESRRRGAVEDSDRAANPKQTESPVKEELKFSNILDSATKIQKNDSREDDCGEERRDDEKKDRLREKESADFAGGDGKSEKYESSSGGGQFGGQSGFGERGSVGNLHLGEVFAARSILHIADLERLISTIRAQSLLGGRREIILQMRRSVLEGLQVKIITDQAARVQIEFLAANEKVRAEIEKHSPELAKILRGRGINLETLKTAVRSDEESKNSSNSDALIEEIKAEKNSPVSFDETVLDNTFAEKPDEKGSIYQA